MGVGFLSNILRYKQGLPSGKEESPLCKEREMLLWTDGDPIPRALDGHQSHRGVDTLEKGSSVSHFFLAKVKASSSLVRV